MPIKHSKELGSGAECQLSWASRRDTGNTTLQLSWVPRYFRDWLVHSTLPEAWTLREQWRRHLILRKFITNWAIWEAECPLLLWKDLRRQNRSIILMPHYVTGSELKAHSLGFYWLEAEVTLGFSDWRKCCLYLEGFFHLSVAKIAVLGLFVVSGSYLGIGVELCCWDSEPHSFLD